MHLLMAFGGLLIVATIVADGPNDAAFRLIGMMLIVLGYMELRIARIPYGTALYQLGHTDGHREGYEEGRRAQLSVVPIRCPRCQDGAGSKRPTEAGTG